MGPSNTPINSLFDIAYSSFGVQTALTVYPASCRPDSGPISLSYVDLFRLVEDTSSNLRLSGVRRMTIVATLFDKANLFESIVLTLALMHIGAISAPIDVKLSEEALSKVVTEVNAQIILVADGDGEECFRVLKAAKIAAEVCDERIFSLSYGTCRCVPTFRVKSVGRAGIKTISPPREREFDCRPQDAAFYFISALGVLRKSHEDMSTAADIISNMYRLSKEVTSLVRVSPDQCGGLVSWMAVLRVGGHVIVHSDVISARSLGHLQRMHSLYWLTVEDDDLRHVLNCMQDVSQSAVRFNDRNHSLVARCIGSISLSILERQIIQTNTGYKVVHCYAPPSACGLACENGQAASNCRVTVFDVETGAHLSKGMLGCVAVSAPWGDGGVVMAGSPFWRIVRYKGRQWMTTGDHGIERENGTVDVLDSGTGFLLFGERRRGPVRDEQRSSTP